MRSSSSISAVAVPSTPAVRYRSVMRGLAAREPSASKKRRPSSHTIPASPVPQPEHRHEPVLGGRAVLVRRPRLAPGMPAIVREGDPHPVVVGGRAAPLEPVRGEPSGAHGPHHGEIRPVHEEGDAATGTGHLEGLAHRAVLVRGPSQRPHLLALPHVRLEPAQHHLIAMPFQRREAGSRPRLHGHFLQCKLGDAGLGRCAGHGGGNPHDVPER